jgi:hypothetical protein
MYGVFSGVGCSEDFVESSRFFYPIFADEQLEVVIGDKIRGQATMNDFEKAS